MKIDCEEQWKLLLIEIGMNSLVVTRSSGPSFGWLVGWLVMDQYLDEELVSHGFWSEEMHPPKDDLQRDANPPLNSGCIKGSLNRLSDRWWQWRKGWVLVDFGGWWTCRWWRGGVECFPLISSFLSLNQITWRKFFLKKHRSCFILIGWEKWTVLHPNLNCVIASLSYWVITKFIYPSADWTRYCTYIPLQKVHSRKGGVHYTLYRPRKLRISVRVKRWIRSHSL